MSEESKSSMQSEVAADATGDVTLLQLITEGKNPRGIPSAIFIENVEQYLGGHSVESTLGALQELYSKYKYMEQSFERSKGVYKSKVPLTEQTLDLLRTLKKRKDEEEELITRYSLCDTLFAEAKVDTSESKVYLWIGASTMVEYTYDEGIELLETQLKQFAEKIKELNEDLDHLRTNSITVEVNMARLFNYNVKVKKLAQASAK
mmetsp:Transcript_16681/g.25083  ORF Transcript_16681/g.25083 Transcript_16681/m.25083 type:complete len:205 (-) Transcript_16681:95-709(-)